VQKPSLVTSLPWHTCSSAVKIAVQQRTCDCVSSNPHTWETLTIGLVSVALESGLLHLTQRTWSSVLEIAVQAMFQRPERLAVPLRHIGGLHPFFYTKKCSAKIVLHAACTWTNTTRLLIFESSCGFYSPPESHHTTANVHYLHNDPYSQVTITSENACKRRATNYTVVR
jgi:UDP-glucose 4-epimerase